MPQVPPRKRAPRRAFAPQLNFPEHELQRLADRIEEDFLSAQVDHTARMAKFTLAYRRWRNLAEPVAIGDEDKPNFRVPFTQWQTYAKWAKELDALFGDDAEIKAAPVGPSDHRLVRKVETMMNWRVFSSMKIVSPSAVFCFRKILNGRSHAWMPWGRRTFRVPLEGGGWEDQVCFDGPAFIPLWPDDLVVPGEQADSIQDFSWVIRKFEASPDALLRGEDDGTYTGIEDHFDDILAWSEQRQSRQIEDSVKGQADEAEGVVRDGSLSGANTLRVWAWMGKWRRLKGRKSARPENWRARERYESDLLVYYLPDLKLVVGVQDLAEMYPTTPNRRPIVEASLVKDGSYWGPGFFELLDAIESEISSAHNLGTAAGQFSVGPVIFYDPASGFDPDTFRYEPMSAWPVKNPAGIKVVQFSADLSYPLARAQEDQAIGERVTGLNDNNLGRSSDRPNAPRTARQFVGLIEEGNIRASLDTRMLREDYGVILRRVWELERMYGSPEQFFRVTEEDAKGLFDTDRGGAVMTAQERAEDYDFVLKFATSAYSREADKQRQLTLYQIDLANPLIAQNPRALWKVTCDLHRVLGDPNFARLVPEPPDPGVPLSTSEEWTLMLEGEDVGTHPDDHDEMHLRDHLKQLLGEERAGEDADAAAIALLKEHIVSHHKQRQEKKLMAALTSELARRMGPQMQPTPGGGGADLSQFQLGAAPPEAAPPGPGAMPQVAPGGAPPEPEVMG